MAFDGSLIFDARINTDEFEKNVEDIHTSLSDLVKADTLGHLFANAITELSSVATEFAKQSISMASDLQEVQNVVDTTFGDGAQQIYDWANGATEAYGISSLAAQQYTGTLGAMLKSMGLADEAVMKMSTDMVGLAGDMASFYNLDIETAFEKIRSGISWETEPLKQLGINMSVANLEAYALVQGIGTAYNAMSQAEQVQLRYNYLMSVTSDAQGDFAKTSESFANRQRILDLNIENLAATAGEQILPVLNEVVAVLNTELPKASPIIEKIGSTAATAVSFIIDNGDAVVSTIAAVAGGIVTYEVATKGAAAAQSVFNVVAGANPYALIASTAVAAVIGLTSFADSLSDTSRKYKELAEESLKTVDEQEQAVNSLETELEAVNKKIDEIQAKGTLSLTDAEELTNLQLENEQLSIQLELEKEILATKRAQSQDDVIGALSMNADYEGSIAYAQNQLDEYKRLQDEIDYWNDEIITAQKTGDENLKYVAETYVKEYSQKALEYKVGALEALQSVNEFAAELDDTTEASKTALTEVEKLNKSILEYFNIAAEPQETIETSASTAAAIVVSPAQVAAGALAKQYAQEAKEAAKAKKQATENLQKEWEQLEHNYAIGVIASEEELYRKKQELLDQYGNENLEAHWQYYEDLFGYQQSYAEQSQQEYEQWLQDEWNSISHLQSLGLISSEQAYQQQLAFVSKYCSEYSDEWHSYYQTIIDYQREAQQEQVEGVRDSLSETVNEYKSAFSELESSVNSYKNRLLSVGDLISIVTETDKDGNETTTYSVENLQKQMNAMQKYHDYIRQLKERGASTEILSELTSYDFEDSSFLAENFAKMSDAEFSKINKLYAQREQLASDLADELYAPEMEQLNTDLINGVIAEFGTLPEEIRSIGAEALASFIEGISQTENLSEKVSEFTDSFFNACNEGIFEGFAGFDITDSIVAMLAEQDTYAIGKEKGDALVNGFNDALNDFYAHFNSEQAHMAALFTYKQQPHQFYSGSSSAGATERIVVENHVDTTVQLEKDTIGKVAYEYIKEYQRKSGT